MSQLSTLDRRSFFRRTLAGGAAMGLVSQPWRLAAAQLVEDTPIRDVRGVGLDDPALVQLSINENPLGSSPRAIEAVAKSMFGMNR